MNTHKIFNLLLAIVFAISLLGMPLPAAAQDTQSNPNITACTLPPWISGDGWSAGAQVTISIDIQNTSQSPDFVTTRIADENGRLQYWSEYRFHSGDTITLTDGITTKSLVVSPVRFTSIDLVNNLITGTTSPNRLLWVFGNNFMIETWSDAQGNWSADFTGKTELKLNNTNGVKVFDDDGDITHVGAPNPYIEAPTDDQWLHARDWPLGTLVTLAIDRPGTSQSPDYTTSLIVEPASWDLDITAAEFNLSGIYPFQADDVITMSGWNITKTLRIANIAVTGIDPGAGTISGTADPGAEIEVEIWGHRDAPYRKVTADSNGHWAVNFSVPWNDQGTYDLVPNLDGGAFIYDDDRDQTFAGWTTRPPTMEVHTDGFVNTSNWPMGALLTITIITSGLTYSAQAIGGYFDLPPTLNLQAGDVITITDGIRSETYEVAPVQVIQIDLDADTVSGTATPLSNLEVHTDTTITWGGCCAQRLVTADASGHWVADFRDPLAPAPPGAMYPTADLVLGSPGQAIEYADAGNYGDPVDATWIDWSVPNPQFDVRANFDQVEAFQWAMGDTLTVTIDNPSTPKNPDYSATQTVTDVAPWDASQTYLPFYLSGLYDIQVGDQVSVSNGSITKTTVVSNLAMTRFNVDADTVSGIAAPGSRVDLWACGKSNCINRHVNADQNGNWSADFAHPGSEEDEQNTFNIERGTWVDSQQTDEDGDQTMYGVNVPANQPPVADTGGPYLGYASSTVTLDAYTSSDPDGDVLTYEWDLDNDGQYDDASGVTITTSFNQIGDHTIGLRVTDGGGLSDTDTATVTVLPWTLKGFYQPVDMNDVYNTVKNGSTVPFKFEIFAGSTELTDIADIESFSYTPIACDTSASTDSIETTVTGGNSLRYDPITGQFIYNWKTPKTAGKCYRVTMMTTDGSSLVSYFKLK